MRQERGTIITSRTSAVVGPHEHRSAEDHDPTPRGIAAGRAARNPPTHWHGWQLKKLDVRTDAGVVTLTGEVPTIGSSAKASEMARGVPGVRSVKNELTFTR